MSTPYRFLSLLFLAVLFFQCQKEISHSGFDNPGQVVLPSPLQANLQGNVLDENGQPAAGVTIRVGSASTVSDVNGYFRINAASLDKYAALVKAEKPGYFTTYRTFGASSGTNQVQLKLIKKNLSGTVSAANGGEVSLGSGLKVALPANGFVRASDNSAYTGPVNVYAAYIDPTATDILERVPGSFMANDKEGKRVLLSSYGMMAVELESAGGEKLQIKTGHSATLTSPIPAAGLASAPATIPLWYVDENTGLWKEEGSATRQGNNYVGTVNHFSYWNCDVPVQTTQLLATFKLSDGKPLVNAYVSIKPKTGDYFGAAHGYTDSLGQINGPVPANMILTLNVMNGCRSVAYTKDIGPYNEGANLGTVTLPAATPGAVTVSGKLTSCAGTNVTNGYAIININNIVRYAKTDANGNFSTNYILCSTNGVNVQVLGVDDATQQQGVISNQPITSPTTNLGSISACGTVSTEMIDYTIDDSTFQVRTTDTIMGSSIDSTGTANDMTYITGYKSPSYIKLGINTTAQAPGSYQLVNLGLPDASTAILVQPITVNFTSFATSPGQFYEGSFTGRYRSSANVTRNISCTFRVRRL